MQYALGIVEVACGERQMPSHNYNQTCLPAGSPVPMKWNGIGKRLNKRRKC